MNRAESEFSWKVRVYYEDTDSGGVVYYANYLKFMERARTEYLRKLGFEQDVLLKTENLIFAVHDLSIKYIKPARFNDELVIETTMKSCGKASMRFAQEVYRSEDDVLLSSAEVKIACLDAELFTAKAIPESIINIIRQNNKT